MKTQLTVANITEAQLRENIARQIAIQAYLLKNIDSASITVTDKEISDFYTEYSKTQTAKVPSLKDLTAQIKQQITTNKQQVLVNAFILSLRAKAKIETSM